jgi:hypothetical protein
MLDFNIFERLHIYMGLLTVNIYNISFHLEDITDDVEKPSKNISQCPIKHM